MQKVDCFAYGEKSGHGGCKALKIKKLRCESCKFYRNDINSAEIEQDIINYANSTYKK